MLPPAGRDPWLGLVSREVDGTPQSPCREAHEGRLPAPLPVGAASAVPLPSQAPGRLVIALASLCLSHLAELPPELEGPDALTAAQLLSSFFSKTRRLPQVLPSPGV